VPIIAMKKFITLASAGLFLVSLQGAWAQREVEPPAVPPMLEGNRPLAQPEPAAPKPAEAGKVKPAGKAKAKAAKKGAKKTAVKKKNHKKSPKVAKKKAQKNQKKKPSETAPQPPAGPGES
jgi:hypothetical protein